MCTSIVINNNKTYVLLNLDLLDWQYRVRPTDMGVYIEILDANEGWLPLFGANCRGDFVGMPTCWPYDSHSDPTQESRNLLLLDIDLLLQKRTLQDVYRVAETESISSVPGITFMAALSDKNGNVLHIVAGQGCRYYKRPSYCILTNFSPFKKDSETHPWMGWDRYQKAESLLKNGTANYDVDECFALLKTVAQEVCPTVVSMVYDVRDRTVYWCEQRQWTAIQKKHWNK